MNHDESLLDKSSEFIVDLKEDLGLYLVHLEKHPSDGAFICLGIQNLSWQWLEALLALLASIS